MEKHNFEGKVKEVTAFEDHNGCLHSTHSEALREVMEAEIRSIIKNMYPDIDCNMLFNSIHTAIDFFITHEKDVAAISATLEDLQSRYGGQVTKFTDEIPF